MGDGRCRCMGAGAGSVMLPLVCDVRWDFDDGVLW